MSRGVRAGWYPDYEAGEGYVRYWDGDRWTDRRDTAAALLAPPEAVPQPHPQPASQPAHRRSLRAWAIGAAALVAVAIGALVFSGNDAEPSGGRSTPAPSSTPGPTPPQPERTAGPTASAGATDPSAAPEGRRTYDVESVLDGGDLRLTNGAVVRLVGLALPTTATCGTEAVFALSDLVAGRTVLLTKRGPDRAEDGVLLRYVERDGVDVGLRMIQRGLASATGDTHARGRIYRRVDLRTASAC